MNFQAAPLLETTPSPRQRAEMTRFVNDGSLPVSTPVTPGGSQFGHNFRASRAQLFTS